MRSPVIGYVLGTFPDQDHVFIANEILALERSGASLRIFTYRTPRRPALHGVFQQIASPISRLPDPLWRHPFSLALANVSCAIADTRRYFTTLRYVIGQTIRNRSLHTWIRLLQAACLVRAARRAGVQHLHAHFATGPARTAMLASMLSGLPYSFTAHAFDIFSKSVDKRLLREKIRSASFVIGVSEYNKRYLEEDVRHLRNGHVRVVYNGVDLDAFHPDPSFTREPDLLLSVGRLVEKKGLADLVAACQLLRERNQTFRCEIVGEGPLRSDLQHQAQQAGLETLVTLPGPRTQEQLAIDYRAATLFVLPSIIQSNRNRDALPTVLLEAMASGCPVISTRVGGIPEIIDHEQNGLLIEPGDVPSLATAIERLLRDPELRARLGTNARRKAEARFDVRKNTVALYRLFAAAARVEPTFTQ